MAALAVGLMLPLAACDNAADAEFGEVTIQLTDAPGENVVEAWVTFTDIYLQGESGEDDPAGGRVYLMEDGEETEELLSLANAATTLAAGREVPTGTYGQLRVVMSDACIRVEDGTENGTVYSSDDLYTRCGAVDGHLQMPSMQQSGAKVILNGLQVTGGQQVLLLDFNVEESFGHMAGNSGMWVMTPVIHTSRIELTGGVDVTLSAGDVTLPEGFTLDQFVATIDSESDDPATAEWTDANEDGVLEAVFQFLNPDLGPFTLTLTGPDGLDWTVEPAAEQTVDPASGGTVDVDWVLQSASVSGGE